MSFKSDLYNKIRAYMDFSVSYNGVTRSNLKIPYYISGQIPGVTGGKGTPESIRQYILDDSSNFTNGNLKSSADIQNFINNHKPKCGVDCSGFAYYCLNEASGGKVKKQFNNTTYENGVSAASLSSISNGTQKTKAKDIVPGCTMFLSGNYNHVIVVYDVLKNSAGNVIQVTYYHSIHVEDDNNGPIGGYISIGNQNEDIDSSSQTWYDGRESGNTLKRMYQHTILLSSLSGLT